MLKILINMKWDADGSRTIVVLNPYLFGKYDMQNTLILL